MVFPKHDMKDIKFDFRIDDIGACTKQYERHSKIPLIGNFAFLKNRRFFGNWGPYKELSIKELKLLFDSINNKKKKLAVAVTASWVEKDNKLIPFDKKFPKQAEFLKNADKNGEITIINHGLSHCVIGMQMPNFFKSNRIYHREFVDWLPEFMHRKHLIRSQEILENWLERPITILAPPGNNYSYKTVRACQDTNINFIHSSNNYIPIDSNISFLDSKDCICFHDREVKLYGFKFISELLKE